MDDRTFEIVGELVEIGVARGHGVAFAPRRDLAGDIAGWVVSTVDAAGTHSVSDEPTLAIAVFEALLVLEPLGT